jgi:hypothetical protein
MRQVEALGKEPGLHAALGAALVDHPFEAPRRVILGHVREAEADVRRGEEEHRRGKKIELQRAHIRPSPAGQILGCEIARAHDGGEAAQALEVELRERVSKAGEKPRDRQVVCGESALTTGVAVLAMKGRPTGRASIGQIERRLH